MIMYPLERNYKKNHMLSTFNTRQIHFNRETLMLNVIFLFSRIFVNRLYHKCLLDFAIFFGLTRIIADYFGLGLMVNTKMTTCFPLGLFMFLLC